MVCFIEVICNVAFDANTWRANLVINIKQNEQIFR